MDYYIRIQNAIDFIESNLDDKLSITDIAAEACFSAFHFQRMFQAISGFSVHEYIRRRRLSEAAVMLAETDKGILDIAMACQYNSQEAFTRAFEGCFGVTPAKYRKAVSRANLQGKMNFLDFKKKGSGEMSVGKPEIVPLSNRKIIGYAYKTNLNNDKHYEEIPGFYQHFGMNEFYMRIPDKTAPNMSYGIACNFEDDGRFSFIVGEEVGQFADQLDDGFVNFEIPEGTYAEFKAYGPAGTVPSVRDYIYGTWLPQSNYERTEGPDFEVTDVMNSRFPEDLRVKIYIPIK